METSKIRGIIPAVITPLTETQELNEEGLQVILEHLLAKGVHGVFVTGSTGEFWALSADEKRRVYRTTVSTVRGRVPVYAGTSADSTREAVALSRMAEEEGVDAVSILTPTFITPTDDELFCHYSTVAQAVGLPILLYGNPARTGVKLSTTVVARLTQDHKNIVGIKDSTGDLTQSIDYVMNCPSGFRLIMGRDTLIYSALLHGAAGAIAASANIAPEIAVGIYERFSCGDLGGALEFQKRLAPLRLAFTLGTFPVVLKEGAAMVGLPAGPARSPVGALNAQNRARLREILESIGCDVRA